MAYVTTQELADWLRIPDPGDDPQLDSAAGAAEAMIDQYCGRTFTAAGTVATARTYNTGDRYIIDVDDFAVTTGLVIKTDEDGDGTFETTWTSTDYQVEPLNNITKSWPVWRIRAIGDYRFPPAGEARVEVTARWGWAATPDPIKTATMIEAARIVRRREAVFGVIESPSGVGADRLFPALDPTARVLADPYRRMILA